MDPIGGVKRAAMIGILITVAMYFIGGRIFDVYATALGPWMILSGIAIWIWFVSGESVKQNVKIGFVKFFKLLIKLFKGSIFNLKKNFRGIRHFYFRMAKK